MDHQTAIAWHADGSPPAWVTCSCGWRTGEIDRRQEGWLDALQAIECAHLEASLDPVMRAKLDEILEAANEDGVTPEAQAEVFRLLGLPR